MVDRYSTLSMKSKSELFKFMVKNGIRDLQSIKDTYNYAMGGAK